VPYQGLKSIFLTGSTLLLDALFPHRCYGCGKYDTLLCSSCLTRLPRKETLVHLFTDKHTPLTAILHPLAFQAPIVSLLIHDFKFQGIRDLSPLLSTLLYQHITTTALPLPHIITTVPLHARRLRERGYNQSALLGEDLATLLNTPVDFCTYQELLIRTKNTPPQSKQKNRDARLHALDGVFQLKEDVPSLKDRTVWLVDDVTTTYTTLIKCAEVLKKAGAKEIYGIVIAH
jgi:competence protein ComFC